MYPNLGVVALLSLFLIGLTSVVADEPTGAKAAGLPVPSPSGGPDHVHGLPQWQIVELVCQFAPHPLLTQHFQQQLRQLVQQRFQIALGETADVVLAASAGTPERAPAQARAVIRYQIQCTYQNQNYCVLIQRQLPQWQIEGAAFQVVAPDRDRLLADLVVGLAQHYAPTLHLVSPTPAGTWHVHFPRSEQANEYYQTFTGRWFRLYRIQLPKPIRQPARQTGSQAALPASEPPVVQEVPYCFARWEQLQAPGALMAVLSGRTEAIRPSRQLAYILEPVLNIPATAQFRLVDLDGRGLSGWRVGLLADPFAPSTPQWLGLTNINGAFRSSADYTGVVLFELQRGETRLRLPLAILPESQAAFPTLRIRPAANNEVLAKLYQQAEFLLEQLRQCRDTLETGFQELQRLQNSDQYAGMAALSTALLSKVDNELTGLDKDWQRLRPELSRRDERNAQNWQQLLADYFQELQKQRQALAKYADQARTTEKEAVQVAAAQLELERALAAIRAGDFETGLTALRTALAAQSEPQQQAILDQLQSSYAIRDEAHRSARQTIQRDWQQNLLQLKQEVPSLTDALQVIREVRDPFTLMMFTSKLVRLNEDVILLQNDLEAANALSDQDIQQIQELIEARNQLVTAQQAAEADLKPELEQIQTWLRQLGGKSAANPPASSSPATTANSPTTSAEPTTGNTVPPSPPSSSTPVEEEEESSSG